MLEAGDTVSDVTAPMVTPEAAAAAERGAYTGDDVTEFSLSDALADGPIALAFIPAVYTRTCTKELCQLRDWVGDVSEAADGALYGASADTPHSQLAFVDEYELSYPLVSGFNNDLLDAFGVRRTEGLLRGFANRSVFVLAPDREVRYVWSTTESLTFPDLDAVEAALAEARDRS